jgi:hypothetical protein
VIADGAHVWGDRDRLGGRQNLLDNAVKFMGDQPRPRVEVGIRQDAGERVFFVRDNGVGIDVAFREKVFGLFEKLDPGSEAGWARARQAHRRAARGSGLDRAGADGRQHRLLHPRGRRQRSPWCSPREADDASLHREDRSTRLTGRMSRINLSLIHQNLGGKGAPREWPGSVRDKRHPCARRRRSS